MSQTVQVVGSIPDIVRNVEGLYHGNLIYYFNVVFKQAQNVNHPYHNFRHMTHVLWLCYKACKYYKGELTPSKMRALLIAAMFHDFDHPGIAGDDDLNVERAIRAMDKHLLEKDRRLLGAISKIMRASEFPHVQRRDLTLSEQIIRDADIAQVLSQSWIQHTIFGLAAEQRCTPEQMLYNNLKFLRGLRLHTEWARSQYPDVVILSKIAETEELLEFLRVAA